MIFGAGNLVLNDGNMGCDSAITIMCATSEFENAVSQCLV